MFSSFVSASTREALGDAHGVVPNSFLLVEPISEEDPQSIPTSPPQNERVRCPVRNLGTTPTIIHIEFFGRVTTHTTHPRAYTTYAPHGKGNPHENFRTAQANIAITTNTHPHHPPTYYYYR